MPYDVVVLGAGPGGYEAAARCAGQGLRTALVEKGDLGGTCLNRGCIPTKSLLQSAHLYEQTQKAASFGVNARDISFDYAAIAARKDKVVAALRKGVAGLLKKSGVEVIEGFGVLHSAQTLAVGDKLVSARNIILATGSEPSKPSIPGLDGENVWTSDDLLSFSVCPESVIIIGGGVIGVEFATLLSALGKKVTILEFMPAILPGMDGDMAGLIAAMLERKGVEITTGARVSAIRGGQCVEVDYEHDGTAKIAQAQGCLVCVGRTPNTAGLGLETVGIRLERGFVTVDEYMRTTIPNIYAIGDITGKMQLAHVATAQGLVAADACAGKLRPMRYDIIPACVYTEPEAASIGLTEAEAKQRGFSARALKSLVAANGKAMVMGEQEGFSKIICDTATGQILGAQILAPRATDMIAEIAAVMRSEGTIEELADTIHPHPSISEMTMQAAQTH